MKKIWNFAGWLIVALAFASGCGTPPKPYGEERQLFLPGSRSLVWAVAPTVNISGQRHVDPLLQSDLVFDQLQAVHGLTVIPVDRVVQVYASLRIAKIESESQAETVCKLLGCDGLVVPTVTIYDPYDPPKMGASLQLFPVAGTVQQGPLLDPHELDRSPTVDSMAMPKPQVLMQSVGIYDSANGTVRDRANAFAAGRADPNSPLGTSVVYLDMDQYGSFVYHELITDLLNHLAPQTQLPK
jgi:hypothetical protein